jgi:hypothetical protein
MWGTSSRLFHNSYHHQRLLLDLAPRAKLSQRRYVVVDVLIDNQLTQPQTSAPISRQPSPPPDSPLASDEDRNSLFDETESQPEPAPAPAKKPVRSNTGRDPAKTVKIMSLDDIPGNKQTVGATTLSGKHRVLSKLSFTKKPTLSVNTNNPSTSTSAPTTSARDEHQDQPNGLPIEEDAPMDTFDSPVPMDDSLPASAVTETPSAVMSVATSSAI